MTARAHVHDDAIEPAAWAAAARCRISRQVALVILAGLAMSL